MKNEFLMEFKKSKFNQTTNFGFSRGISADNNKKVNKGISKVPLNSIITQINNEKCDNPCIIKDKMHSLSPQKNSLPEGFLLPPQLPSHIGKKTLVLDLDETLIHSSFEPFRDGTDIILNIEMDDGYRNVHVLKRPGVDDFLVKMGSLYEIVIFTASISKYADPLIDILDGEKVCTHRLFRENCIVLNGSYVKELKRLNRNIKNVIILDNNPYSYYLDKENGIPIKTFKEEKIDKELAKLISILEKLAFVSDVRDYIKDFVYNNQINYDKAKEIFASVKQGKDNCRLMDNKNFKILSVEKLTNQSKPVKPISKILDTKNTTYTSFRASITVPNKNLRIMINNKNQKSNISLNKQNELENKNSNLKENNIYKLDELIEIEVVNTDPSIKNTKNALKQSQSIKNNLKLNLSKKDLFDRRNLATQNFQSNNSKEKNRKVVNSLSLSKLKINAEEFFKNKASMISARSTKSNSTNVVNKERTLATSASKEKILKHTLANRFKVTNNITTQKSITNKSNFKIVKVTSNLKSKIEKPKAKVK